MIFRAPVDGFKKDRENRGGEGKINKINKKKNISLAELRNEGKNDSKGEK